MKYLIPILFFLTGSLFSNAQAIAPRSSPAITAQDARLKALLNFYIPVVNDTSAAALNGGLDSLGCLIQIRTTGSVYIRDTIISGGHKWTLISSLTPVGGQIQYTDTSGNNISGPYPLAAYDITGRYIANVLTDTDYVSLWNTVQANRSAGVLSLGIDSIHFTFNQTQKRVQATTIVNPNQITSATLAGWYDFTNPSTLTFVDSTRKISVAKDLSGNGRDISQATDASRPTWVQGGGQNGLPFMQLKGASINTSATFSIAMPITVYIVMKPRSFTDLASILTYGASYDALRNRAVNGGGAADSNLTVANNAQYTIAGKTTYRQNAGYIFTAYTGPTLSSIRINNETPFINSSNTLGSNAATHFNFGPYDAEVYEVIIYAGAVSSAEDILIRRYLTQKYNIKTGFAILWFGDSITHGQNSSDNDSASFAALVTKEKGFVNANFGVPNSSIDTIGIYFGVPGSNFRDELNNQVNYDPNTSYVVMMYGTNDWYGINGNPGLELPLWKRNYERLIQRMITYGFDRRRMLLCSPPYQTKRYPVDTLINQTIQQVASDLNIRYFNGYQYCKDRGGDALLTTPDSIHLTNAGHRIYANGVEEALQGIFTYYTQGQGFFGLNDVETESFYSSLMNGMIPQYDSIRQRLKMVNPATVLTHTIFVPVTGGTVTLVKNQLNIINPAGSLSTLTVTVPSTPSNNDVVYLKFTQTVTTITYSGGTVVGAPTTASPGQLISLTYDSSTSSWY